MTTEIISKSDMISPPQLSYSEVKSQAPSVSFLPGTRRFHLDYNTARWGTSNYVFPTNFSAKEHIHPRWEFFQADNRRTTNALGGQQADNKFSRKIVVRQMGCCPPNPFSGGQRADKNTILTTLLSVLSALSAKPANPWYVGLFRADNKFATPPVCCPPVVRHTIYDTERTTRTTRTRRTRRTRRTTDYTKRAHPADNP